MTLSHLQILLADDDSDDRMFFDEALQELPISTHLSTVKDGVQLMKYLTTNLQRLPQVLFLDLNMPLKNGFECLDEIKRNEHLKSLPVIILSTSRQENIIDLLYTLGANRYIRKSTDFTKLKLLIYGMLKLVAENKLTKPTKESFVLNDFEIA